MPDGRFLSSRIRRSFAMRGWARYVASWVRLLAAALGLERNDTPSLIAVVIRLPSLGIVPMGLRPRLCSISFMPTALLLGYLLITICALPLRSGRSLIRSSRRLVFLRA